MSANPPAQGRPAARQILLLGPALQPGLPHLLPELLEESGYQAQLQSFAPLLWPTLAGPGAGCDLAGASRRAPSQARAYHPAQSAAF